MKTGILQKILTAIGIFTLFTVVLSDRSAGAILSVTLTPAPPTVMSTGQGFYLAGNSYDFDVRVIDPAATAWNGAGGFSEVRLIIPNSTNINRWIVPNGVGAQAVNVTSGTADVTAAILAGGTFNDFTVRFTVALRWNTQESAWAALRGIQASATSSNTLSTTVNVSYGVCTSVRWNNAAQNGDALDGFVSSWNNAFTITGAIIYNFTGANNNDKVYFVNGGAELTGTTLFLDGAAAPGGITDNAFTNNAIDDITYTIPIDYFTGIGLGNHTWSIQASFTTAGGPEVTTNTLSIRHDRVETTSVQFVNGGGVFNPAPAPGNYYRSLDVPGTQIRINARMESGLGGGNIVGNITVTARDTTDGLNYTFNIANGTAPATPVAVNISTNPPVTPAAADNTLPHTYQIISVTGGPLDDRQNAAGRITQPAIPQVYWDNQDPPGAAALPFNGGAGLISTSQTANSLTIDWPPLANAHPDLDFDSYRIRYRESPAGTYSLIDRNTPGFAALGTITTATATITGLSPLTAYDMELSAVDVFGNEVNLANRPSVTIATTPFQIDVAVSDGVALYSNQSFTCGNINPAQFPVRDANIKVSINIITAGNLPDQVNLIIADNDSDLGPGPPQYGVTGTNNDVLTLTDGVDRWRIPCAKTGANLYEGYIQSDHPLMEQGRNIRFIIETVYATGPSYSDCSDEATPPGDATNDEWRFQVSTPTLFIPWPTRILNNVLTRAQPCAYPAYFLPVDALVTIKVYDIKGRPVATILDRAYRKGGQNIKDLGWCGTSRDNKKLGVGLYYIHIRATLGKRVILNEIKKVVVAR